MAYDSYKRRIKSSSTPKEKFMSAKKKQIEYLYNMAMDKEDNCLLNNNKFNESPRIVERAIKTDYYQKLKAITVNKADYINSGDVLSYDDDLWLCTSSINYRDLYCKAYFVRTNYMLRWQNSNGDIVERRCLIMSAAQYNSGEVSNNTMILGSDQIMITLPLDRETLLLDNPKRLMVDKNTINPTAYKITRNDTIPYSDWDKGCITVVATQCVLNTLTDNVEEMICDYVSDTSVPGTEGELSPTITYTSDFIKSGGSSKKFYAKFLDENGNNIEGTQPIWQIDCDFKDELIVQENDNFISISIDNDDCIGEYFELILTCEGSSKKDVLSIEVREF